MLLAGSYRQPVRRSKPTTMKSSKKSPKSQAKKPAPKPRKSTRQTRKVLDRVKALVKPEPTQPKPVPEVRDFSKMTFEQQSAYVFNVFPPVELGMVIAKSADHKTDPFAAKPLKPAGK